MQLHVITLKKKEGFCLTQSQAKISAGFNLSVLSSYAENRESSIEFSPILIVRLKGSRKIVLRQVIKWRTDT
jgi:hypothetical protein